MNRNSSASFVRKAVFIVVNRGSVFLEYFWNSQRTGRALRICTRTYTHESPIFAVCGLKRVIVRARTASDSYYWRTSHEVTKTL